MRIAHLTWSMGIGGTQTMLTDIANIQVQEGHEVGIFVIDTYISDTIMSKLDSRVNVFFMGRTRGTKPVWPFIKLNWKLWKYNPDIIHSHAGKLINIVFNSAVKVVTAHGVKVQYSDIKKYVARYAISNAVKEQLVSIGYSDTLVIEDGIHCNAIKQKTDFSFGDTIHIVQVSRIYLDVKGQDLVVKALKQLQDMMSANPILAKKKCIVHFVGDGIDTDKLKHLVTELKLDDYVVFEGFRDREWIYEHLCEFDLFIQASRWEGFGLTVAEACAAKVPVLVSNIQGPLEIIDGGRLGMTFQSEDVNDLADKLYDFVCNKPNESQIEEAYQYTLDHYDVTRTAQRYMEEYKKVLANY